MSPFHVPFDTYKRNLKRAEVLQLISQGYSPRQIARRLNCGVSGLRKLINRLKEEGFLTKKNLLTTTGVDMVGRYPMGCHDVPPSNVPDTVRLHDFVVKCKVEDPQWENKREKITHLPIRGLKSWTTPSGKTTWFPYDLETGVRLTTKSVLIKMPDVYAATPLMAKEEALKTFYTIRDRLESLLKVKLKKRADFNFCVVSNQHVAFIHDELAKYFLAEGITLRLYDNKRQLLWVVDDSLGLAELEAVHKAKAEEVGDTYKDFLLDLSLHDHLPLSALTEKQKKISGEVDSLFKAIETHTQTQQNIIRFLEKTLESSNQDAGVGKWN